jgi:hypothetical protein
MSYKFVAFVFAVMAFVGFAGAVDVLVYGGNGHGDSYGARLSPGSFEAVMFEETLTMDMHSTFKNQENTMTLVTEDFDFFVHAHHVEGVGSHMITFNMH